jgi:hypothetical protein
MEALLALSHVITAGTYVCVAVLGLGIIWE